MRGRVIGLRPLQIADAEVVTKLANDPAVRQSVVGWDWPVALDGQADWIASGWQSQVTRRLAIVNPETDDCVGLTGLWDIDWHNRSALSGIKLDVDVAPKGAAFDAVMLVNAWAFHEVGLHRLRSAILPFNAPSYHLYVRKCGWVLEGIERESVLRAGSWHDLAKVAILDSDFDAHADAEEYRRYVAPNPIEYLPGWQESRVRILGAGDDLIK